MKVKKDKLKILIICRFNSKRLKFKIKKKILGKSLLEILILRLCKSFRKKEIIICSGEKKNKFFEEIKKKHKINVFYGSEKNIFKRIIRCCDKFKADHFVRITGDNPLTDIKTLKKMTKIYFKKKLDFIYTNGLFPGLRSEIMSISSLKKIYKLAEDPNSSEYLTYFYLRKNFNKIYCLNEKVTSKEKKLSITIDTEKDFKKLKKLIKNQNDIYIKREQISKRLKPDFTEQGLRLIPLVTKNYNVRFKSDAQNFNFINLKEFHL